jgi:hypothetical protein
VLLPTLLVLLGCLCLSPVDRTSRSGERAKHRLWPDEVSPLTPEELAKVIREMPRDPEVVEMLKKFSAVDPLPSR